MIPTVNVSMIDSFRLRSDDKKTPDLLVCRPLEERGLPHGFSLRNRRSGETNPPYGLPDHVDTDLEQLESRLGVRGLVRMRQVHGTNLIVVSEQDGAPICDGLFTSTDGLALVVQTADCVPLLMWDADQNAVAAVHAGWRGTLERIAERAVAMFQNKFSSHPESIHVAMGPAIGPCCYEVGTEILRAFTRGFASVEGLFSSGPRGREHLDLIEANRRQLVDSGISLDRIHTTGLCTSCENALLYSYRKEGKGAGRLYGVVSVAR